jgi:hypothetical protein
MADLPIRSFTQDFLEDYSDDALLSELRRVSELSPGTPLTKEFFAKNGRVHSSTIVGRFGSWEVALTEAGLADRLFLSNRQKAARRNKLSESMIAELRRVAQMLRPKALSIADFNRHAVDHTGEALRRHFGSWTNALRAVGLSPRRRGKEPYTKDELLKNLESIHRATGSWPTYVSLRNPPSLIGPKAYERSWGSFSRALVEYASRGEGAGRSTLAETAGPQPLPARVRALAMSDEQLCDELRRVHQAVGRPPTQEDVRTRSGVHPATIRRRLGNGTWLAALSACGIPPSRGSRRFTDDDLFANVATVWTELGRRPKYDEMKAVGSQISAETYVARYGSWRRALLQFLQWADAPDLLDAATGLPCQPDSPVQQPTEPVPEPLFDQARVRRDARRSPGARLRFQVLQRDRFRCVLCGRSPSQILGLVLHIDHVVPWAKGGPTELANLRTLCGTCNLGKGDQDDLNPAEMAS